MDIKAYCDLVAYLPQGKTLFRYGRDQFAPMLLGYLLDGGWGAQSIRASRFARLCERPPIKALLAAAGKYELSPELLSLAEVPCVHAWRLTLGKWGNGKEFDWNQTSRRGCSLVLQLNFSNEHDCVYRQLFPFAVAPLFSYRTHAGSTSYNTLAWARLDIDLDANVALIEEIQSDWVKRIAEAEKHPETFLKYYRCENAGQKPDCALFKKSLAIYAKDVLPRFARDWQEIMLAACLHFVFTELGLRSLFMHEFETGNRLKNLWRHHRVPPRSIYEELPRKFCFEKSSEVPQFLAARTRGLEKKHKDFRARFWQLAPSRQDWANLTLAA